METISLCEHFGRKAVSAAGYFNPLLLVQLKKGMEPEEGGGHLIGRFDHETEKRVFKNNRISCTYTHVSTSLVNERGRARHFALGAVYAIDQGAKPEDFASVAHIPPEQVLRIDKIQEYRGPWRAIHPELHSDKPAHIYPEKDRLHDVYRLDVLDRHEYAEAERYYNWRRHHPGSYRISGLLGNNCETFYLDMLDAVGRDYPAFLRHTPWPYFHSKVIEAAGLIETYMGLKSAQVFNGTAAETRMMFERAQRLYGHRVASSPPVPKPIFSRSARLALHTV